MSLQSTGQVFSSLTLAAVRKKLIKSLLIVKMLPVEIHRQPETAR